MKKLIIILLILCSSCRVAKKDWLKETFAEKATVKKSLTVRDSMFRSEISKIETSVSKIENSISKIETSSGSTSENESTTVSGSITAEDGKEKTATVGNTTITSNGANISFTTTTSKEISKAFEIKYQEQQTQLQLQKQTISSLRSQLTSLKTEFANFVSTYESEKNNKTKTVKKTGFQAGVWIIVAVVVIVLIVLWYFRKSIPFLN